MENKCNHQLSLPLYARSDRSWLSSKKILGKMVYVCTGCGAILDKGFVERNDGYRETEQEEGEAEEEQEIPLQEAEPETRDSYGYGGTN